MRPLPRTPSKADDGIERLKLSLTTKWGIQLPVRGSTWSPSGRDPNRAEERICTYIQFLYFRDAALDTAIANFERNAVAIDSKWQYKAKAELDIIPSRESSQHDSRGSFLRTRNDIPVDVVRTLTESLLHHLSLIADRVKHGETFPRAVSSKSELFQIHMI